MLRTDAQRENSIPSTNKVCGGYNYFTVLYQATSVNFLEYLPLCSLYLSLEVHKWNIYSSSDPNEAINLTYCLLLEFI